MTCCLRTLVTTACAATPASVAAPRPCQPCRPCSRCRSPGTTRQVLIERTVIPEAFFAAADAAVARLDRRARAFVPAHHRAGVVGHRALAAHLVKAISLARVLVVPRLDEQAGIVIRPAIAGVVNAASVELLGPAQASRAPESGRAPADASPRHHHVGDRRAARHVDHRLVHQLVNRRGAGRIRLGGLHAAV